MKLKLSDFIKKAPRCFCYQVEAVKVNHKNVLTFNIFIKTMSPREKTRLDFELSVFDFKFEHTDYYGTETCFTRKRIFFKYFPHLLR